MTGMLDVTSTHAMNPLHSSFLPPFTASGAVLRVATYNIHKGVRGVGPAKRLEIHNLGLGVEALDADLVFLQEVRLFHNLHARDFDRSSFGWPDRGQAEFLAPEGYDVAYRTNAITRHGEHGNALVAVRELRELGEKRVRRDELRRRAGRIVRSQRAGRARCGRVRRQRLLPENGRDGVRADAAGPQQHRRIAGERDDRAFDADVGRAAVEYQIDRVFEIVGDVQRRRRRDVAEAIGRRRGDAAAEFREQRVRDRMRRNAQPHTGLAAGDGIEHVRCARHDQR